MRSFWFKTSRKLKKLFSLGPGLYKVGLYYSARTCCPRILKSYVCAHTDQIRHGEEKSLGDPPYDKRDDAISNTLVTAFLAVILSAKSEANIEPRKLTETEAKSASQDFPSEKTNIILAENQLVP